MPSSDYIHYSLHLTTYHLHIVEPLLAQMIKNRFEYKKRSGCTNDGQRLTSECSVKNSANGTGHKRLHCTLFK